MTSGKLVFTDRRGVEWRAGDTGIAVFIDGEWEERLEVLENTSSEVLVMLLDNGKGKRYVCNIHFLNVVKGIKNAEEILK